VGALTSGFAARGPGCWGLPLRSTARRGRQGTPQARPDTSGRPTLDDPGGAPLRQLQSSWSAALRLTYVPPFACLVRRVEAQRSDPRKQQKSHKEAFDRVVCDTLAKLVTSQRKRERNSTGTGTGTGTRTDTDTSSDGDSTDTRAGTRTGSVKSTGASGGPRSGCTGLQWTARPCAVPCNPTDVLFSSWQR